LNLQSTGIASRFAQELFGGSIKEKILQRLYTQPDSSALASEAALAREIGVVPGSMNKALRQLVAAGLIVKDKTSLGSGYRAPLEDPRLRLLIQFFRQDSLIVMALRRALKPFKTIEYAYVFGSFARGTTHKGSDVDVLVLETSDEERYHIKMALSVTSDKIGREANGQFYSVEEFRDKAKRGEVVPTSILTQPRIDLKGSFQWP